MTEYKRYDHWLAGNDLMALQRAHDRCRKVLANRDLPWFEREKASELLSKGSLIEYEQCREDWAELARSLPAHL